MKSSCHDWNILHHTPNLLNSTLNCIALVVAGRLAQKSIEEYAKVVRRSQEASGGIKKGQEAAESVRKCPEASGIFRGP